MKYHASSPVLIINSKIMNFKINFSNYFSLVSLPLLDFWDNEAIKYYYKFSELLT